MLRKVMWSGSSVLSCAAQKARLLTAPEEKASSVIPRQVFQDTGWKVWPKLSTGLQTQQLRIYNLLLQAAGLNLSLASRSPPPEPSCVWQRFVLRNCWPSTGGTGHPVSVKPPDKHGMAAQGTRLKRQTRMRMLKHSLWDCVHMDTWFWISKSRSFYILNSTKSSLLNLYYFNRYRLFSCIINAFSLLQDTN